MPIVNVIIENDDPGHTKLQNATVYFYNTIGVLQTSAVTNNVGTATVTLPDATYDLYVFLESFSCVQPQRIVVDSLLTNVFKIIGHLKTLPEPQDPKLCRVSGYLKLMTGIPARSAEITLTQYPKSVTVSTILGFNRPITIKTDDAGYFEFDLYRKVKHNVSLQNYEGFLDILVPDRPSVRIGDLLFPIPRSLVLNQTTISIPRSAGQNSNVQYTLTLTDGNIGGPMFHPWYTILISISNPSIVEVGACAGKIVLTPLAAGTSTVTFTRLLEESELQWIDPQPFTSDSLTVTVT